MNAMALQVAATLIRLQYTVCLTGVFSSIPWNRLLKLNKEFNRSKMNKNRKIEIASSQKLSEKHSQLHPERGPFTLTKLHQLLT